MSRVIGQPIDRSDAMLKVTGMAKYAADYRPPNLAYGVPVGASIAKGKLLRIDATQAVAVTGVLAVLQRANIPAVHGTTNDFGSWTKLGEDRVLFADDEIHYAGQYIALVVATSHEAAIEAAARLKIEYTEAKPILDTNEAMASVFTPSAEMGQKLQQSAGNVDAALTAARFTIKAQYTTPIEHHNPMEPCAATAVWNGADLTQYDATQWVMGARNCVADMLAISREKVHIVSHFVGGGFGSKGFTWPHQAMAPIAARQVKRPVQVSLSRAQMFSGAGHRPETDQTVMLACDQRGKLTAVRHETISQTSEVGDYVERCGGISPWLYDVANYDVKHKIVRVNISTPTPMRGPGENPGLFALESAMDELAVKAGLDPIELRLRNYAEKDGLKKKPYSSKHLRECYQLGAEKFGWKNRGATPRSMSEGNDLIGYGMATATYPGNRYKGAASVRILEDGSAIVASATQDIGTGTYTTMRQMAAETLGIDVTAVRSELGDSRLPPAPVSGGSMTTASVIPVVEAAAKAALEKLQSCAMEDPVSPFHGADPASLYFDRGRLRSKLQPALALTFSEILKSRKVGQVEAEAVLEPGKEQLEFSFHSFGAQFVEVRVDRDYGIIRVARVVSVLDIGTIINPKTARSQVFGGVIQGVGMALMEQTRYDRRNGRVLNDNLAEYLVPVNADIQSIEAFFIDKPDPKIGGIGARGIGEIGITGVAPAIANAVFHATGKRIRNLPIVPEKLLGA